MSDIERKTERERRGRGEGAVRQHKTGLWEARISLGYLPNGRRRTKSVYGKSKLEALRKMRKVQKDHDDGKPIDLPKRTVSHALDAWINNVKRAVEPTTLLRYEAHAAKIKDLIGNMKLRELRSEDVLRFDDELSENASPAERRKVLIALRMCFNYAVKEGWLHVNPARLTKMVKLPASPAIDIPSDQLPFFLEAVKQDRHYTLYLLALDSGAREGELFALRWPDVNFETGMLSITKSLQEVQGLHRIKPPKSNKSRSVKLMPETLEALKRLKARAEKQGLIEAPIFCDKLGGFLRKSNWYRRSWLPVKELTNELLVKDGKPKLNPYTTFHSLRHTCASTLLRKGVNPKVVSERLGHATVAITLQVYSHLCETLQHDAATALSEAYFPAQKTVARRPRKPRKA